MLFVIHYYYVYDQELNEIHRNKLFYVGDWDVYLEQLIRYNLLTSVSSNEHSNVFGNIEFVMKKLINQPNHDLCQKNKK